MEYVDVLDHTGKKTGNIKALFKVHKDGDWHRVSHVWILNGANELLIQKRSSCQDSYPNKWDISAAGHISAREESICSAIRETKEELGIEPAREAFQFLFTLRNQTVLRNGARIDNEIQDVYLAPTNLNISEMNIQKEEVAEIKFVDCEELERMIASRADDFVPHSEEYKRLFEILKTTSKK